MPVKSNRSILRDFHEISALSAISVLLFMIMVVWRIDSLHNAQIQRHMERQGTIIESEMKRRLLHTRAMLNYMASQIGQRNDEKAKEYYLELFNAFTSDPTVKKSLAWSAVAWVRSDRRLTVDSAMGILKDPIDMSNRAYIALSERQPGKLHFGKPVTGAISKRLVIPAAIGVVNASGKYLGSLIVGFDVQHMGLSLNGLVNLAEEEYVILDHEQNPLIRSHSKEKPFTLEKPYVLQAMDGLPFSVYVTLSDTFRGPSYVSILRNHLVEFLSGALLLAAMLFYLHRRIVRPIGNLAHAAEALAGGNMDIAIPRNGAREIEALADRLEDVKSAVSKAHQGRATAEEENRTLEKIMTAKTRQARNLVHDMRAHASIVITFADIISSNQYDRLIDPQYADYANDIRHSGNQILDMVNEMLDLEKARNGKLKLEQSQTDMATLLEQTMRCFMRKAEARGVGLKLEMAANMPELYADPKRLRRMVQNLISNSLKFTRKGGAIRVSYTLDEEDRPVIRVIDTGRGMTAEEIQIALTEYGQVQHDDMEHHDSTGIGLPFVKQMMEEHGGHLEIESEPGKGTTVSMIFDAQAVRYTKPRLTLVKG